MTELKEKDACCPKDKKMEVEENQKITFLYERLVAECQNKIFMIMIYFTKTSRKYVAKKSIFNDIIETPIILGMIPELYKKKVLDIGCGMGQHALQYSKKGRYPFLELIYRKKLLAYARKN